MRGAVEQVGVGLKHRLGAVAVMDVEIDHRDPAQPPACARVMGGDRGVVEQAEAHRLAGLGVMAGGRTAAKAASAQPSITASTAMTAPPAARSAAAALPALIAVSASSWIVSPGAGRMPRMAPT